MGTVRRDVDEGLVGTVPEALGGLAGRLERCLGGGADGSGRGADYGPAGASVQKPTVWVNKTSQVTKNQWVRLHLTAE